MRSFGLLPEALAVYSAWTSDEWREVLREDLTVGDVVDLVEKSDMGWVPPWSPRDNPEGVR